MAAGTEHDLTTGGAHEWARLQTSLHGQEAVRLLDRARASLRDAVAAHPDATGGHDLDHAVECVDLAISALHRVDARMHAEDASD